MVGLLSPNHLVVSIEAVHIHYRGNADISDEALSNAEIALGAQVEVEADDFGAGVSDPPRISITIPFEENFQFVICDCAGRSFDDWTQRDKPLWDVMLKSTATSRYVTYGEFHSLPMETQKRARTILRSLFGESLYRLRSKTTITVNTLGL